MVSSRSFNNANVIGIPKRHFECSFDNYIVSPENAKQFEVCKNWDGKESIVLTGKTGTGKSHLAIAMLKCLQPTELSKEKQKTNFDYANSEIEHFESIIKNLDPEDISCGLCSYERQRLENAKKYLESENWKYRKQTAHFVSVVEMFIKINDTVVKDGAKQIVLDEYAKKEKICLDDLGAEKLTDAKRENLYYIIDSRYKEMLPTIITSNFTIDEINDVEPRIASRLAEMGKIIQFNGSDYRKSART